ncbi:MAG TPA: hypothetical protein VKZ79_19195 [Alphaproteobacteria bacterium]|nr:hypothetical protein [Alphaproteobacteria bacterium]
MKRFVCVLGVIGMLFVTGARADEWAAVPVLQQILQQLVIMSGKLDALNGRLDAMSNRAYGAGNPERAFVFAMPGSFAKGPKEDGKALCANLGGALKGAYAYGGTIIVSCNY